jgi:hypothetical protein
MVVRFAVLLLASPGDEDSCSTFYALPLLLSEDTAREPMTKKLARLTEYENR